MRKPTFALVVMVLLGLILLPVSAQPATAPLAQVTTADLLALAADVPYAAPLYVSLRLDSGYIETLDSVISQITAALPAGIVPPGITLSAVLDLVSQTVTGVDFADGLRPLVGDTGALALGSLDVFFDSDYRNDLLPAALYLSITDRSTTTALLENLLNAQFRPGEVLREDLLGGTLLLIISSNTGLFVTDDTLIATTSLALLPTGDAGLNEYAPFIETIAALPAESYNAIAYVDMAYFGSGIVGSNRYQSFNSRTAQALLFRSLGTWAAGATVVDGRTLTGDLAVRPGNRAGLEALGLDLTGAPTPVNPALLARLPADTALVWHGSNLSGAVDLVRSNARNLAATWGAGLIDPATADALIESALVVPNAFMTNITGLTRDQLGTWLSGDYLIAVQPNLNYVPYDAATGLPFDFGIILEATDAAASRDAMVTLQRDLPLMLRSLGAGDSNLTLQPARIAGAEAILVTISSYNYAFDTLTPFEFVLAADDGALVFGARAFVESVLENASAETAAAPFDAAQSVLLPDSVLNLYVNPLPFIGMINSITFYSGQAEQLRVQIPEALLTLLEHATASMIIDEAGNTVARFTLTLAEDQPANAAAAAATYQSLVATATARFGGSDFAPTQIPFAATPTPPPMLFSSPTFIPTLVATESVSRAPLAVGESVRGTLDASERDAYTINLDAGDAVTFTMESLDFDTFLEIQDDTGQILAFNDDRAVGDLNSEIAFNALATATYTVFARAYSGSASGSYTLSALYAVAPTEEVTAEATAEVTARPTATPTTTPTLIATEEATAEIVPTEAATVEPVEIGDSIDGTLPTGGSLNYSFTGAAGDSVTIALTSPTFDTVVEVYDAEENRIASNDDFSGTNSRIENLALPTTGTYRLLVRSYADGSGGEFTLVLSRGAALDSPTPAPTAAPGSTTLNYDQAVNGNLRTGARDSYTFTGRTGDLITIDMEATFDTYLRVENSAGFEVASNDDRGDGTFNSRIARFRLTADGIYTIRAGSYNNAGSGDYTLTLTGN